MSNTTSVNWFQICHDNPDLGPCASAPSFYGYRLSLAANAAFLAIFAAVLAVNLAMCAAARRGVAFTIALSLGLLCEILGYAGRVLSYHNQWQETGFFMQICCLTIGPAFMAAGIYLCLRRIVQVFGAQNSRIPPKYYTRVFIPCDVVSLVLQAAGGGLAATSFHGNSDTDTGDNIMIAGLAFQVFTMLAFMILAGDFALRTVRRRRSLDAATGSSGSEDDETARLRGSLLFRGCVGALVLATVCIFWRSVFRVAELSRGWSGPVMKKQGLFIGFEGVLIAVACTALVVFHPAICLEGARAATKSRATKNGGSDEGKA